jgi:transcriptional regulator of acetoin/glycerol metabolism
MGTHIQRFSPEVLPALLSYPWPGNVRELENVLERAIILSPGPTLELEEMLLATGRPARLVEGLPLQLDEMQRAHILAVLERCNWKIKGKGAAAATLGLNPSTLYARMKKLGIKRPNGRKAGR